MSIREETIVNTVLTVADFQHAIYEKGSKEAKAREQSVVNVLNYFQAVRPKMSTLAIKETLNYLNSESWVKSADIPSRHTFYKRAYGHGKRKTPRLYYPDLIIVHATFPNNPTVRKLVQKYSEHWGFDFSRDGPSYLSGLDAATELRLFRGIRTSKEVEVETLTASQTKVDASHSWATILAELKETQKTLSKASQIGISTENKTKISADITVVTPDEPCDSHSPQLGYQLNDQRNDQAVVDHDERVRNLEAQLEQAKKDRDRHRAERAAYHRQRSDAHKRRFEYHATKAQEYSKEVSEQPGVSGSTSSLINHERPEKRQRQTCLKPEYPMTMANLLQQGDVGTFPDGCGRYG
ncbi:hypothetical protein NW762_013310 [Fusarium torreyae]|uniref:Uncharacterized protein n=1 Tax=Fusarium torreyae TaxID=1237075 RepID=A0A9W8RKY7_9HYPO|nr:hypothetical protein NW762_013310 [Fusarium torreyae]